MLTQTRRLPLFVAITAFVIYLGTLGSQLNLTGLSLVSKLAGWDTSPMVGQPLLWLLTLPLQILPVAWLPLAVKLLSAALASVVLALLTRSVQLLPWDHPWDNASRTLCLLPLLAAALVCGLEFSYWQEATSSCGELLDLLLMAAAIWLLLEYNVRQQPRWLQAATVVWGVGMAENWAMLITVPLFIIGIIWIERLRFFRWRFILRLALLGLAGFSIYIIQPMVNGLLPHSPWNLHQAWSASLHQTKIIGLLVYYEFLRSHHVLTLAVIIYFLVPTLPLFVRMRDEGTYNKLGADQFQVWLYRVLRLGLLLVCFWLAFDPVPAVRQMVLRQASLHLPLLTLDYINALGVGFLLGNLLLITLHVNKQDYRSPRGQFPWRKYATAIAAVVLGFVAAGLFVHNAPAIARLNFHPLEDFGEVAVKSLPAGSGVILCDYADRLLPVRAALARRHRTSEWLVVDTHALPDVTYRARLDKHRPSGWLTEATRHELTRLETTRLLMQIAQTNRLFYLHPSYGEFLEAFYQQPVNAIFELKLRGRHPLDIPALSADELAAGKQFWDRFWDQELAARVIHRLGNTGLEAQVARLGILPAPRDQDHLLAEWYSIPLQAWGVTLQRQNQLQDAAICFDRALRLNTNDLSARISMSCNTNLQAGVKMGLSDVNNVINELGSPDRINALVDSGGPFDEPTVDYIQGCVFLNYGMLFQAVDQLERTRVLAPGSLAPEMALADIYNRLRLPERSRPLITHLHEQMQEVQTNSELAMNVALLDSGAWLLQTNVNNARSVLEAVAKQYPDDRQITGRLLSAYIAFNDFTNALNLVNAQLAKSPDDPVILNTKAIILLQSGKPMAAIPLLDHVLSLTNEPSARMNRAFAQIGVKDFTAAKNDLNQLEKDGINSGMLSLGQAIVAEQNADTNGARHYLEMCLTNTPAGSPLWQQASARLHHLNPPATRQ